MAQNEAKIRIRVGSIEIEYEGDKEFLSDGLEDLLNSIALVSEKMTDVGVSEAPSPIEGSSDTANSQESNFAASTATIAAYYGAKTGPELAICAMAHLEMVQKSPTNDRSAILKEMKTASAFYNDNMGGNIAQSLKTMAKSKRINDVGSNKYALSKAEREKIEATIAGIA